MNNQSPCAACPHHERGFCDAVLGKPGHLQPDPRKAWQYHRVVPAGQQIVVRNQSCPDVFVLCVGWGFRFVQLADGRRQILHFLLPGDLFSVSSVFEERPHFSVKALTEVQVSGMRRREVQIRLARDPAVVAALAETCSIEAESSDEMAIVLGQYSAEERIAFLLLQLMRRIAARNVVRGAQYPFPLRQQHIADAVGLTAVHVSRTLSAFRERGVVEVYNGALTVIDRGELAQLTARWSPPPCIATHRERWNRQPPHELAVGEGWHWSSGAAASDPQSLAAKKPVAPCRCDTRLAGSGPDRRRPAVPDHPSGRERTEVR